MDDGIESIFRGGVIIFLSTVIQLFLGLLGKLLFARYLGPQGFGGVSIGITLVSTGSTILALGMNMGITRYIPRFDGSNSQRSVVASATQIALPVSIFVSIILYYIAPFVASALLNNKELSLIIRTFSLVIPIVVTYKLCNSIFQGLKSPLPVALLENITRPTLYFFLIGIVVVTGGGTIAASAAYILPWIIVTIISVIYAKYYLNMFFLSTQNPMRRELLAFSLPLVFSVGMQQIFNKIDIFLIGALGSVSQVGVYAAVYPIARVQLVALTAINFVYTPIISELDSESAYMKINEYYSTMVKWVSLCAVPLIAVFLTHPSWIVQSIFGSDYITGSTPFLILASGFFFSLLMGPTADTIISLGDSKFIMATTGMVALLNVILNVVLIPEYGITGAAAATAISYISLNSIYIVYLRFVYQLSPFSLRLIISWIVIFICLSLFEAAIAEISDNKIVSVLSLFSLASIMAVVFYLRFLHFSSEEAEMINRIQNKIDL